MELIVVGAFLWLFMIFVMKLFSKKVKLFAIIVRFAESLDGNNKGSNSFDKSHIIKNESSGLLKYDHLYHDPSYSSSPANIYYDSNKDR
jgi:hypothetical protein